jgi:hypothetical protein
MPIEALLWLPGAAATLAGSAASCWLSGKLNRAMGLPNWDFTRSWASNITVAAGLLTISTLPSLTSTTSTAARPALLTTAGYTVLSVMYTLLAAIAPMVFNFSRTVRLREGSNPPEIVSEGRAWMFILAAILTLWGALGQLELQGLLMHELQQANAIPFSIAVLLEVIFGLIALGLIVYGIRMMIRLVEIQPELQNERRAKPAEAEPRAAEPEMAPSAVQWPLL